MSSEDTSPVLSVRSRSVLASRPPLLRGEDFGLNVSSATKYERDTRVVALIEDSDEHI